MTVSSTTNKSGPYLGNGSTVDFDYEFRILDPSHVTVIKTQGGVDTIVSPADYTVSGVGAAPGGTLTFLVAPTTGQSITIIRNAPFTQQTDLENQGAYYAETVEAALDLGVMRDQQLAEGLSRAVQIPIGADPSELGGLIEDIIRLSDSADEIDTVAGNIGAVNTAAANIAAIIAAPAAAATAAASATAAEISETAAASSASAANGSAIAASASAVAAASSAASINLPAIGLALAGSLLFVNPTGTGYDLHKGDEAQAIFSPGIQSNGAVPAVGGWWADGAAPLPKIHRIQDRVFIGDATKYNGRQNSPYGGSSLNLHGASWVEKHGRVNIYDNTGHIALLTAAHIPASTGPGDSMGMAGSFWIVNEGNGTGGRAVYIEAMAKGLSGGTSGVELQCGNYTGVEPAVMNSYNAAGQVCSAFFIGAESGINYQVGDGNDPITPATKACGAVFDINGGSLNAVYQRFKAGIVFRDNSLYRDIDGLTGNAVAIGMAKGHAITWAAASNRAKQAKIRSDVSSAANVDVSLLFLDSAIQLTGAGEVPIAQFQHTASAVNWLTFQNAAAGGSVAIGTTGNDANIVMNYLAKGTGGEHRLQVNNAIGLRILGIASAANYLQVQSAAAAGSPTLSFQGADTNGSLTFKGKGTGGNILQDGAGATKLQVNATGVGFFAVAPVAQKTGWGMPTGTFTRATFVTSSVTLPVLAEHVAALIQDLHATAGFGLLNT